MGGVSRRGVLGHVFTVGGFTALSRVLGLVREMMQSRLIGAGVEQSAFTLAFALPNMARKLFGEGALTAAFVPVFKGLVANGEVEAARRLARAVLTMLLMILGSAVVLVVAGLGVWSGCSGLSPRAELTLRLVRILFPYMVFICGAAFGMGVLNALGRFVEGAVMPAFLNLVWIAALAALLFFPGLPLSSRVTVVCWAILAGGAAQMAFLFHCMAKRGYSPRLTLSGFRDSNVALVWRNTAIAAMGAGAVQVNCMLDQVLAQMAAPWAAGVIGYAERLMDLPLGVVGVAFGTVLLPTFAGLFAKGDAAGAQQALASSATNLMFVMLPAAAGMCLLAPEITSVIYEGRAFDAQATVRVSRALAVYALGLGFYGVQKALIPWFQAQKDMKTPLHVSVCTVALNAVLNILAVALLPQEWRHVGLAASTVACAAAGCALLGWAAR
ncbi:MAG: murein biosynthesis integral membrane protein MurJ, partial [Kiritimatiellae bacterium]|nr:murein biosynthesis integral membrane protein MurJ [Kiritimatiellia bacterium]